MNLFSTKSITKLGSLQIFQLLRFGAVFIVSVVLAHVLNDKAQIGFYEKLLLIGGSTTFFWVSGFINVFIPQYHAADAIDKKKLEATVFWLLCIFSLLLSLILLFCTDAFPPEFQKLFQLFIIYNLFNAPAFFMEYAMLVRHKNNHILGYGFINFIFHIGAVSIPLLGGEGLEVSFICLAITAALRFAFMCFYLGENIFSGLEKSFVFSFLKKASPYILSLILGGSLAFVDSYTVNFFYHDDGVFAVFRYGARELPFVLLMANAFSNVMSGELAEANAFGGLDTTLQKMKKKSAQLMHLLFPITIILLLISKPLYGFLYGEAFITSSSIFCIYLLLIISRLIFPQTVLLALQKNNLLLKVVGIEWAINIAFNIGFVLWLGLAGVAYATVLAYFSEKLMLASACHKMGIPLRKYTPINLWLIYTLAVMVAFGVSRVM
ncbi:MAG: hypothetical protein NTX03_01100 [Bacteroidetes bacterium]|nr:hypothetical protein [Bacteroidota bacterium]